MNKTLVVFAALLIFTNVYAENTNENVGAWSEAVNGLRGRLIVTQEKEVDGVQSPKVFLELQNVANILNPIQIDAFNPESSFRCRLMDGAGKIIRSSPIGIREVGSDYNVSRVGETPTCSLGTTVTPPHVLK
jgi:hypothetical protein